MFSFGNNKIDGKKLEKFLTGHNLERVDDLDEFKNNNKKFYINEKFSRYELPSLQNKLGDKHILILINLDPPKDKKEVVGTLNKNDGDRDITKEEFQKLTSENQTMYQSVNIQNGPLDYKQAYKKRDKIQEEMLKNSELTVQQYNDLTEDNKNLYKKKIHQSGLDQDGNYFESASYIKKGGKTKRRKQKKKKHKKTETKKNESNIIR